MTGMDGFTQGMATMIGNVCRRRRLEQFVLALMICMGCETAASAASDEYDMKNRPPKMADQLPQGDLCKPHVMIAYLTWVQRWMHEKFNEPFSKEKQITQHERDAEYDKCNAEGLLDLYAIDLVWQGKGLRETEEAVLTRCRALPRRALETPQYEFLCMDENYQEELLVSITEMRDAGEATRRFIELLKRQKAGEAIDKVEMAEAYWAAVDEQNGKNVRAELEALKEKLDKNN